MFTNIINNNVETVSDQLAKWTFGFEISSCEASTYALIQNITHKVASHFSSTRHTDNNDVSKSISNRNRLESKQSLCNIEMLIYFAQK